MKFDAAWLMDLLDGAPAADEVVDRLTACGFLVELREPGDGGEIWDVEVTTNRPDAMNHRGLAREVAVATGAKPKPLEFSLSEVDEPTTDHATIEVTDPGMCRRFCARVIRGVGRASSPDQQKGNRAHSSGNGRESTFERQKAGALPSGKGRESSPERQMTGELS